MLKTGVSGLQQHRPTVKRVVTGRHAGVRIPYCFTLGLGRLPVGYPIFNNFSQERGKDLRAETITTLTLIGPAGLREALTQAYSPLLSPGLFSDTLLRRREHSV